MSGSQSDHSTVKDKLYPRFLICHRPASVFLVLNTLHYTPVKRWMENMELDLLDEQSLQHSMHDENAGQLFYLSILAFRLSMMTL